MRWFYTGSIKFGIRRLGLLLSDRRRLAATVFAGRSGGKRILASDSGQEASF